MYGIVQPLIKQDRYYFSNNSVTDKHVVSLLDTFDNAFNIENLNDLSATVQLPNLNV